jgi:hypothetical protein
VREEHETGDHKFGRPEKPWGALRLVQKFSIAEEHAPVDCELCSPLPGKSDDRRVIADVPHSLSLWYGAEKTPYKPFATAFYADMLGFGWALCSECSKKFTTEDTSPAEVKPTIRAPSSEAPAPPVNSVVKQPAVVLAFERRSKHGSHL